MSALSEKHLSRVKKLYYERKFGAPVIAKILGVSTDAVYYLMRRYGVKRRSFSEENAIRFQRKPASFRVKSGLSRGGEMLKVAGVMLYWGEGFQSEAADIVDFANSRPDMVLLFLKFLRTICGIDESKIRVYLYCYANQNVSKLLGFWSRLLKIPKSRFTKPYVRKDFDVAKVGKMKYGLIHIRYGDKKLLNLIREWIKLYIKKFAQVVP